MSHGARFQLRIALGLLLVLSALAATRASAISISPSPSTNGSFTVNFPGNPIGCWQELTWPGDPPVITTFCYKLYEDSGAGWQPVSGAEGQEHLNVSGKAPGTYSYFLQWTIECTCGGYDSSYSGASVEVINVSFTIGDASVDEGGALSFTVTRNGASPLTHAVSYSTADNTATVAGNDYSAASGSVSFPPSQNPAPTQTIVVNTIDEVPPTGENHETLFVNLTDGGQSNGATIADSQGIGTINNDDAPGAPSNLGGPLGITGSSVTLTWSAAAGYVTYHEIERTFDGAATTINTGGSAASYAPTGLTTDGIYRFRVRACANPGAFCGPWSNAHEVVRSNTDTATGVPSLINGSSDAGPSTGLTNFNGVVAGQAGVAPSGAATYAIPIAIPPGTRGMQPSLALIYNSHGATGPVGRGWALAGAGGAVTRCGKTMAQDSAIHTVDYTANDRFCLDGQRLVMTTAGTYGGDAMRYRTELESFRDVVSNGGTASSPNSFTVRTGDGQTLSYGGTSASNFQASAPNATQVAAWLLRRVEDKYGNYFDITYFEDEANGYYHTSRIDYTGHLQTPVTAPYASVEFFYQALTNPIKRYQAGSVMSVQQRLTKITVKNGVTPVREYVLAYDGETPPLSGMSRLTSVKECAPTEASAVCTAPTTFDWINEAGGLGSLQVVTPPTAGGFFAFQEFPDLNGDGKTDVAYTYLSLPQQIVFLGTETGLQPSYQTWNAPFGANGNGSIKFRDVDGDGDSDFIRINPASATQEVYKSTGTGYAAVESWVAASVASGYGFFELNGDGRTDFVTWQNTSATETINYYVRLSTGSGYTAHTWTGPKLDAGTPGWQPDTFSFHDTNADGRDDLVLVKGTTHRIYVNNGAGFNPYFEATTPAPMPGAMWADLNGDSLLDYNDGTTVAIWTGRAYVTGWGLPYAGSWGPRDMNGDGLADQVDGNAIRFSTGNTYVTSAAWSGFTIPGSEAVQFPDFDGDGKPDVKVGFSVINYALNQSTAVHLMERVTDGLGMATTFTYKPLSDSAIHTKLSNAAHPTADLANAVHVVTQISQPDGIGGTFDTTYRYKGFKVDKQGRGSLGFAEVTTEDVDRKVKTITTFSQTFPFIGLVTSTDVTITDKFDNLTNVAQVISETDRTYVMRTGVPAVSGPTIRYVCSDTDTTLEYDVESSTLLRTTLADNDPGNSGVPCDDYGNPGQPGTPDPNGIPLTNRMTVTDHVANPDVVHRGDTVTYYLNDTANWLLGLPTRQVAKPFVDGVGDPTKDRTAAVTYIAGKGVVFNIVREPEQSAPIKLTTEFEYDLFGNRKKETITPSDTGPTPAAPAVRIERVDFDSGGRFPAVLTNAEGHITNMTFDAKFGAVATIDGPNATVSAFNDSITRTFDAFGRMKDERRPDGSYQVVYYKAVAAGASGIADRVPDAKFMIETGVQNAPWSNTSPTTRLTPVRAFFDGLGRELRARTRAFDATNFVHVDTHYDSRGRVQKTSEPYYEGQTKTWNTPAYDVLNRAVGVTAADATQSTTTDYNAFTVTTTDAGNRQNRLIADALGRTVRTENLNASGTVLATTEYVRDKAGNVTTVRKLLPSGTVIPNTVITNGYDRLGRRLSTTDPDFGIVGGTTADGLVTFQYDSMGDLRRQQTPRLRQQSTTLYTELDYDKLARLKERRDPSTSLTQTVTSAFTYDQVPASPDDCRAGIGHLTTEAITGGGEPGLTTTYCYSPASAQLGQLANEQRTTGGVTYRTDITYDALGRLQQVRYPATTTWPSASRYAVNYLYTPRGHLERVQEAQGSATVLYQTTGANARGQIEKAYLGDGSRTTRSFVKNTERLAFTNAAIGASQQVQNFVYGYDAVGNISGRGDLLNSVSEAFGYDALDRLTASTVTNGTGPHPVTYAYDDAAGNLGNMKHKSDISTLPSASMSFSTTARPHALTTLNTGSATRTFTYDANGRMTDGQVASGTRTLAYTSYDLLASATISGAARTFNYGPDRQRYRQVAVTGANTHTYTYIGEHYVKEVGSATEHKLYIMANGEPVAYVSDDGTPETKYFHKDHLGSITTIITNQNWAGREKLSYDAWGKRRHGTDWWSAPAAATEERGYTGHEHLDNVTLIHMNGRAYDPQLARFTSPDPFVPAPLYSQSYNRYAYVYANPLRFTDPSGFAPLECPRFVNCGPSSFWPRFGTPPTDDGFDFAGPSDWAYHFQQEAIRAAEQQAAYAVQMNYTLSMDHPAAKTDQEGLTPGVLVTAWRWVKGAVFDTITAAGERGTPGTWGAFARGSGKEAYNTVLELNDAVDLLNPFGLARQLTGVGPRLPRATIADDELGGGAFTEGALFAAGAFKSLASVGNKLLGGVSRRLAQAFCCFAAGTLIATETGLRPIEEIEVGDRVWARSEETRELALKPVTALIRPHERVIWTVTYEIDEGTGVTVAEFDTTDDHPWAGLDGTWLRTDELKPGMEIQRAHGVPARVMSVIETERTEQTYNLEVADFHTYFVGEAWVWVHNAKCGGENVLTAAGRRAHQQEPLPNGFKRDVRIPGTRLRMDGYNAESKQVLEIKPPGPRAVSRGERQLENYCAACDASDLGPGHTSLPVQTYDPSRYIE